MPRACFPGARLPAGCCLFYCILSLCRLQGPARKSRAAPCAAGARRAGAGSALWKDRPLSFRVESFKRERFVAFAEDRAFPYFTFREYLSYAAAAYGRPTPDVQALVAEFGFEPCTDVLLRELSTGNRKKAALITAFALQPELLLLDEPVNGLDFQSTETLYRLMAGYRQRGTLLFSSHILESICLTADRVLVLEQGRIRRMFAGAQITAEAIREVLRDDAAVQSDH